MGNRLSRIYTRTGDQGSTGLGDGSRISKDSRRVEAIGQVDELNALLGIVLAQTALPGPVAETLSEVQHQLFDLGGELCLPAHPVLEDRHIDWLEQQLDTLNAALPPLKEFILPGGSPAAAHCHHARTVCRRAERRLLSLSAQETLNPAALAYLNRLSDLLFVMARTLARQEGGREVLWRHTR